MFESLELARTFLGKQVTVIIDRPLGSTHPRHGFIYEVNYGFVPGTVAPDGEELDAYYLGVGSPVERATGRCVALIHRDDDDDDKLIVVPSGVSLSDESILEAVHFQEQYFKSELVRA